MNQFNKTLDKNLATNLFKMLMKYRPRTTPRRRSVSPRRRRPRPRARRWSPKPVVVKYGINHITYLVEQKKAQLVCIAHDVDPSSSPSGSRAVQEMNVPYCIVKGKARLGAVVHKKTATALALTAIKNEDKMEFSKLVEAIKGSHNDRHTEANRKWGGGIMGAVFRPRRRRR